MLIQVERKLPLVNATAEGWQDTVRQHIDQGSNFILILSKDPSEVTQFCQLFGLPDDCTPRALSKGEFFLLGPFVDDVVFDKALDLWNQDRQLVFVEQIDFPVNRPPHTKSLLVYSPILGILSQHGHLRAARDELQDFEDSMASGTPNPEAAVYFWKRGKWCMFEGGW